MKTSLPTIDLAPLLAAKRTQGSIRALVVLWLTERMERQAASAWPWLTTAITRERMEWMK